MCSMFYRRMLDFYRYDLTSFLDFCSEMLRRVDLAKLTCDIELTKQRLEVPSPNRQKSLQFHRLARRVSQTSLRFLLILVP